MRRLQQQHTRDDETFFHLTKKKVVRFFIFPSFPPSFNFSPTRRCGTLLGQVGSAAAQPKLGGNSSSKLEADERELDSLVSGLRHCAQLALTCRAAAAALRSSPGAVAARQHLPDLRRRVQHAREEEEHRRRIGAGGMFFAPLPASFRGAPGDEWCGWYDLLASVGMPVGRGEAAFFPRVPLPAQQQQQHAHSTLGFL